MQFNEEKIPTSILDKYTKICTCCSVSKLSIKNAINNGCTNMIAIKEQTGATKGACKGKNCSPKIVRILKDMGKL